MKREYRVRKHSEFDRIIKGGKRVRSPHFALYALPCVDGEEHGFVGVAVSKANGGAVQRVRAKRQVRAMLGNSGILQQRIYLIVVIRPSYQEGAFHENEVELLEDLNKIKDTTLE